MEYAGDGTASRILVPIADDLGSVLLVVDGSTGAVVHRRDYDGFGRLLGLASRDLPFGYGGGFFDWDTELTRFGARDVDHETGRWTTRDPVRFKAGSMNLFLHAGADPLNALDPTGLATYRCRRALGDHDKYSDSTGVGPFRHDYLCVQQGDHMVCNGMGQTGDGFLYSDGRPTNKVDGSGPDQFHQLRCRKIREDDPCIESCIASRLLSGTRPDYSGIGYNCQSYARHVSNECALECAHYRGR